MVIRIPSVMYTCLKKEGVKELSRLVAASFRFFVIQVMKTMIYIEVVSGSPYQWSRQGASFAISHHHMY
ncbi:hypothetical protein ACFVP8_12945 [Viridibacillus arvi]|uniref:hypothetical protein n=1 Tax=Viridibacillus arvi TaxID=263475 RepID=UPI0036D10E87